MADRRFANDTVLSFAYLSWFRRMTRPVQKGGGQRGPVHRAQILRGLQKVHWNDVIMSIHREVKKKIHRIEFLKILIQYMIAKINQIIN